MATAAKPKIGSIGQQLNLLIKQGGTFGPHEVTLTNPDSTPVNLTGCTLEGGVKHKVTDQNFVPFAFVMTDPANGVFTFGMTDETTSLLAAGAQLTDLASKAVYDISLNDTAGQRVPLFYGDVEVFRRVT